MKKILSILMVHILVLSGLGAVAITSDNTNNANLETSTEIMKIDFPSPTLVESNNDYVKLRFADDELYLMNPGQPMLPRMLKSIELPFGARNIKVEVIPQGITESTISKEILPTPSPVPRSPNVDFAAPPRKDINVYTSDALYPSSWYSYNVGCGLNADGEHVTHLTVNIYPVRYAPATGKICVAEKADVIITFDDPERDIFPQTSEYDLVIIAPSSFSSALQQLVDHKNSYDMKTLLKSTEEIYNEYTGVDKPEQIKYFIKDAIENWNATYILFVGGMNGQQFWSWHVPIRYSHTFDGYVLFGKKVDAEFISDLYFADIYKYDETLGFIFDDWDSNENNIFGEWTQTKKDILDLFPDVYVGRLPCRSLSEVQQMVNRIINYETSTYDQNWFKKIVVIGGDTFKEYEGFEGQIETEHALSFMDGYEQIKIWVEGGDYNISDSNIIDVLSQGEGFAILNGHGNTIVWGTSGTDKNDNYYGTNIRREHINQLNNNEKLPILIVGGCHNCEFDVSLLKIFSPKDFLWEKITSEGWGWIFTTAKNGGSIATIGGTGFEYGYGGEDENGNQIPDCIEGLGGWLDIHFFQVYNHHNKDVLGETHGQTITDYLNQFPINWDALWMENSPTILDCKTVEGWVLLGDPSLKIGGYSQQ